MGNLFIDLPVPAGDGSGAAQDTSALGELKTVSIDGVFQGSIFIEFSCGGEFKPLITATRPGKYKFPVAAKEMRVRREDTISGNPKISVGSSDPGGLFGQLPVDGSSLDVSAFGTFNTVVLGRSPVGPYGTPAVVYIEISEDGVSWSTCMVFTEPDHQSKRFTAKFMRVRNSAGLLTQDVWVGAINDDFAATAFGPPITVEGSNNLEGASPNAARADHKHRLELKVSTPEGLGDCAVVGQRPQICVLSQPVNEGQVAIDVYVTDKPAPDDRVEVNLAVTPTDFQSEFNYSSPITVRGANNQEGVSNLLVRKDHQHRLELEGLDEGVLQGARPAINFLGAGVGLVDNPGQDRLDVTIPGNVTDGAVVKRSTFVGVASSTTSLSFVDGMSGLNVTCPINGDYLAIVEGECSNQSASGILEVGISVNSVAAVIANSERQSQGPAANLRPFIASVQLPGLIAGDLARLLFRRAGGAGTVRLFARHLILIKVQ